MTDHHRLIFEDGDEQILVEYVGADHPPRLSRRPSTDHSVAWGPPVFGYVDAGESGWTDERIDEVVRQAFDALDERLEREAKTA